MDMKLELVPVPVTDVDRAKAFYVGLGFAADVDVSPAPGVRVVQLTPPGSACSISIGTGLPAYEDAPPGSVKGLHLVVRDIEAARADLVGRGGRRRRDPGRRRRGPVRGVRRPRRQHPHAAGDELADRRRLLSAAAPAPRSRAAAAGGRDGVSGG